jgi:hypothetical protein
MAAGLQKTLCLNLAYRESGLVFQRRPTREEIIMQLFRRVALVIMLVISIGAIGLSSGSAPARASTCYAFSCHGHDPIAYGCPVSSTVTTYGALATVWNRYSAVCKANWVRAQLTPAAIAAGYQWMIEIWTTDSKGYSEDMCEWTGQNNLGYMNEQCTMLSPADAGYTSTWYSDMVDGTNSTTASVIVFQPTSAPWPWLSIAQYNATQ